MRYFVRKALWKMRYSRLFGKTLREIPKGVEAPSHKFLVKAGFVDQLLAGAYTLLPLGWRVHRKIENIIREEMEAIGAQEILMPTLQKKEQWVETGRWSGKGEIDPPLFKFKDRQGRELALGPTHEEVVTDLARRFIASYKDLPLAVFQIQNKFRNELRPTGGLLRLREFSMKDLYSFHADETDLDDYYLGVMKAYQRIFGRCGLDVLVVAAYSGTIGGSESHEFMLPSKVGEDTTCYCEHCHFATSKEKVGSLKGCPECGQAVFTAATVEMGHIFKLGTLYSEKMKALFTNRDGTQDPLVMGCYGIGVGRIMAAAVETSHDKRGIIWPKGLTPYDIHLVALSGGEQVAEQVYGVVEGSGFEALYDDRSEAAGVKLVDADLIGIPIRVIVSAKSIKAGGVEVAKRSGGEVETVPVGKLVGKIREVYSRE